MSWKDEGVDSPMRRFFSAALDTALGDLTGKDVLDIGSGTGYCSTLYKKLGARTYQGIEPSEQNVTISRELFPDFTVTKDRIEDCSIHDAYDVIVSVMVFEHIADPISAFKKIIAALRPGGKFYLICGDKDVLAAPKFDYRIVTAELPHNELVAATTRSFGTMYDILRPLANYVRYGETAGLQLARHIPLPASETLIEVQPQFEQYRHTPFVHLLAFDKPLNN